MTVKLQGIYTITNLVNNKVYVGSSKDIMTRWSAHINLLKRGKHHNKHRTALRAHIRSAEHCKNISLARRKMHYDTVAA